MKIEVSVIVPVYNAQAYLEACVRSFSAQTFTAFELVLVDDGSTDASWELCERLRLEDERIRCITVPNGGPSNAKNEGLKIARGKYVMFCDSDDTVGADYIKNLMQDNTEADLVVSGYKILFVRTEEMICNLPLKQGEYDQRNLLFAVNDMGNKGIINVDIGKRYKRSILQENEIFFDKSLPTGEDLKFNCRYIADCNSILLVRSADYNYFRRDIGSQVSAYRDNQFEISCECIRCIEEMIQRITDTPEKNSVLPAFYLDYLSVCILNLYRPECKQTMERKIVSIKRTLNYSQQRLTEMERVEPKSFVQKLFLAMVRLNIPMLAFGIYSILFWGRYHFEKGYYLLRKRIMQ